jgi:arylsulfatase A-like enzyme/cytochrome c-type biogenesis protein CcmH/NrfG
VSRPLRFTFILFLAGLGTALAAVGGWRYARASAPLSGPIIMISIDTLRADHLPPYGYSRVRTPAIDALAADGVLFERAYSHSPQTLPAHAALLSGRLPFENGVRDDDGAGVKTGERLLPQMLRDRGYATAAVVSSDLLRKDTGIGQGFAFFDPPSLTDTRSSFGVAGAGRGSRDGAESEKVAERWLASNGSARAFLFLHLNEPHAPYAAPERFAEYAPYDGEIAYADEIVGRLVKYLKSHQLYDRSTIVLLSDHGEGLGDHGEKEHGLFVYEEAVHVPLIIKQESNTSPGRRVADVVQHIDLVPTILDLVKAPIPWGLRGRSLKPLLEGTGRPVPLQVYAEALYGRIHFGWSELTALTDDRHQYIKAPREELYDLQRDAHEHENLAADRATPRRELRSALERLVTGGRAEASTASVEALPDPKEKSEILNTYRAAVDLADEGEWAQAIPLLQTILREDPELAGVWSLLNTVAARIDRDDEALNACWHLIGLRPEEPAAYLGAAAALLKLKKFNEAREQATLAAQVAPERDRRSKASAHEVLARIALARHNADGAQQEAALARKADPAFPLPLYVEGRLLYDLAKYDEALPLFEQAIAQLKKPAAAPIAGLHFYTAETLTRLERGSEAEAQFLDELRLFPQNLRARSGLAMLYHAGGRSDEAVTAVTDMIRAVPTPDSYALAARLLTTLGDRKQADAVRADARRAFADTSRRVRPSQSR